MKNMPPFYMLFQVFKVLLITICKMIHQIFYFLLFYTSLYISRHHFSQIFRTSLNILAIIWEKKFCHKFSFFNRFTNSAKCDERFLLMLPQLASQVLVHSFGCNALIWGTTIILSPSQCLIFFCFTFVLTPGGFLKLNPPLFVCFSGIAHYNTEYSWLYLLIF